MRRWNQPPTGGGQSTSHKKELILTAFSFSGIDQHSAEHAQLLTRGRQLAEEFQASTLKMGDLLLFLAFARRKIKTTALVPFPNRFYNIKFMKIRKGRRRDASWGDRP